MLVAHEQKYSILCVDLERFCDTGCKQCDISMYDVEENTVSVQLHLLWRLEGLSHSRKLFDQNEEGLRMQICLANTQRGTWYGSTRVFGCVPIEMIAPNFSKTDSYSILHRPGV